MGQRTDGVSDLAEGVARDAKLHLFDMRSSKGMSDPGAAIVGTDVAASGSAAVGIDVAAI